MKWFRNLFLPRADTYKSKYRSLQKRLLTEETRYLELNDIVRIVFYKRVDSIAALKFNKGVKRSQQCEICNSNEDGLTAHHLWPKGLHPTLTYSVDNGVCLCRVCHDQYHKEHKDMLLITPVTYQAFKKKNKSKTKDNYETNYITK